MEYQIITIKELQAMLRESKGAKIVTITTLTYPDLKKNCPYKNIRKISTVNGVVNFNYSNAVNRQRERESKEPTFKSKKRSWGTRLDGLPFISHVNKEGEHKLYLEMKVERSLGHHYKDGDGTIIVNDLILPYLKDKKSVADHQGVEKEIIVRDYPIDSIITINIGGQGYIISHKEEKE